jgi:hypothetical protein
MAAWLSVFSYIQLCDGYPGIVRGHPQGNREAEAGDGGNRRPSSSPGTGLGGDDDQLAVDGGTLSLDDTTLQILDGGAENNPRLIGNVYVIVNGGAGSTGVDSDVFGNAPASGDSFTTADGFKYDVFYAVNPANTSSGADVDVELVAIPEAGTWASLLGGFVVVAAWQRARRRL